MMGKHIEQSFINDSIKEQLLGKAQDWK